MVEQAFLRANIPFITKSQIDCNEEFCSNSENFSWTKTEISGDFLLKHINTSLEKNLICFTKSYDNLSFTVPANGCSCEENDCTFSISEISVLLFDTGIGIVSVHLPYTDGICDADLVNTCAALRCSTPNDDPSKSCAIFLRGQKTYLSCIVQEELLPLLGDAFVLFGQFNDNSPRRIDMFSAVLCSKPTEEKNSSFYDKLCYLLANTFDNRDKDVAINNDAFYRQHEHRRWSFSKRGCSVVANLTDIDKNNNFLKSRWFDSVKSNYLYLYLMVLHQKYAIYNYLNTVAEDNEMNFLKLNREALLEFNSKYIFSIVSDETFIQNAYMRMKAVNNVEEVYIDLQDELKRMFDYTQIQDAENNEQRSNRLNLISLIISAFCSISIVIDTINLFTEHSFSLHMDIKKALPCLIAVGIEVLILSLCFISMITVNRKKKK